MLVKIFILYCIIFYLFHTLKIFKSYQKELYTNFYFKDNLNINGLMYEPYDFSDISNSILSILVTPYGMTITMFTILVIISGYIPYKWFILLIFVSYMLLIIGHNLIIMNTDKIYYYYVFRFGMLMVPFFSLFFSTGGTDLKMISKVYVEQVGPSLILIMLILFLEYVVSYNYSSDLGKYLIKNERDYKKVYVPKWTFVSFMIPIYIILYVILRERFNLTNTFVISSSLTTFFFIFSYLLY